MPNEIEIKFRVEDAAALTRRLKAAGFRLVTPRTHEMNRFVAAPEIWGHMGADAQVKRQDWTA